VTGMGLLERAHAYKEKVAQGQQASVGLFAYPVLMAADILIYQSTLVPVGKDQIQHVEMAQDMATHFNQAFSLGEPLLRRPEYRLTSTPYVTGTDGQKMSSSYGNIIPLFEAGKPLRRRIAGIVTDSTALGQPLDPERCNVFALLRLFADPPELARIESYYRSGQREGQPFGYGHAKQLLAERIEEHFVPARARRDELLAKPELVEQVLARAAERARREAQKTMARCRKACGLP